MTGSSVAVTEPDVAGTASRNRLIPADGIPVRGRRAAFICGGDPDSARTWSGSPFHMLASLREFFDFEVVIHSPWAPWFKPLRRLILILTQRRVDIVLSPFWAALGSREACRKITQQRVDFAFCVGIAPICAVLCAEAPTVFVSDATAAGLIDYNPRFTALSPTYRRLAMTVETRAVSGSIAALYPSAWACNDALRSHTTDASRVHLVHWGANLVAEGPPPVRDGEPPAVWRLLFIGVDWQGKGGDIAVATVRRLAALGLSVHLDIVGSQPPSNILAGDPLFTLHGFLDKNDAAQRAKLLRLFGDAHLLLFPTQFEALGIVSAEAASFAMPVVAFDTGGVAGNIVDGETGILLAPGTPPEVWTDVVAALLSDPARYAAMCAAALDPLK